MHNVGLFYFVSSQKKSILKKSGAHWHVPSSESVVRVFPYFSDFPNLVRVKPIPDPASISSTRALPRRLDPCVKSVCVNRCSDSKIMCSSSGPHRRNRPNFEELETRTQRVLSRNAIAQRRHREKRKAHMLKVTVLDIDVSPRAALNVSLS